MYLPVFVWLTMFGFGLASHHSPFDYCDMNYCPPKKPNVGCGCKFDPNSYGPGCAGKNAKLYKFSEHERQNILDAHNRCRNQIACGRVKGFPPAVRMVQLRTNDDLQTLAECHVKNCTYEHDKCRNTERFHYAGQNMARRTVCGKTIKFSDMLNSSITAWYEEYRDTGHEMMAKYPSHSPRKPIGHFTLMVNDNVYFIGCAMSSYDVRMKDYFKETGENCRAYYFLCNYSFINLKDKPTYNSGPKPASKCRSGKSKQFGCLCKDHEPYSTIFDWEAQVM